MRMKNRQARFAQAGGAISAFLATVAMTASASIVVINENFDIDDPVGGDPATLWTGSAPLPPDMDEFFFAGFLRGEGIVEFVTKPHQGIVYCRLPSLVGYLYIKAV